TEEVVFHLDAEAFFKIEFPFGVIGVGFAFDFRVPLDGRGRGETEPVRKFLAFVILAFSEEPPFSVADRAEVFLPYPASWFGWVSSFSPSPQGLKDVHIYLDKRLFAGGMAVIVRPTPDFGVEESVQRVG